LVSLKLIDQIVICQRRDAITDGSVQLAMLNGLKSERREF